MQNMKMKFSILGAGVGGLAQKFWIAQSQHKITTSIREICTF